MLTNEPLDFASQIILLLFYCSVSFPLASSAPIYVIDHIYLVSNRYFHILIYGLSKRKIVSKAGKKEEEKMKRNESKYKQFKENQHRSIDCVFCFYKFFFFLNLDRFKSFSQTKIFNLARCQSHHVKNFLVKLQLM